MAQRPGRKYGGGSSQGLARPQKVRVRCPDATRCRQGVAVQVSTDESGNCRIVPRLTRGSHKPVLMRRPIRLVFDGEKLEMTAFTGLSPADFLDSLISLLGAFILGTLIGAE